MLNRVPEVFNNQDCLSENTLNNNLINSGIDFSEYQQFKEKK